MFSVSTAVTALGGRGVQGALARGTCAASVAVQMVVAGHAAGQLAACLSASQEAAATPDVPKPGRKKLWASRCRSIRQQGGGCRGAAGLTRRRSARSLAASGRALAEGGPGTGDGLAADTGCGARGQSKRRCFAAADMSHSDSGRRFSILHLGMHPFAHAVHMRCTRLPYTVAATHALDPRRLPHQCRCRCPLGSPAWPPCWGRASSRCSGSRTRGSSQPTPSSGSATRPWSRARWVSLLPAQTHTHQRWCASRQYRQRHSSAPWPCPALHVKGSAHDALARCRRLGVGATGERLLGWVAD